MHDIDFLPAEYLHNHARRQWQPWRVFVVLLFSALIAAAAFGQHHRRSRLEADLAAIAPRRQAAAEQNRVLGELQSQWRVARADAELFTYLRHPWPRTRILGALLAPLPEEITFEQLEIRRQTPAGRPYVERLSRSEQEEQEAQLASQPPAARDLKQLRDQFDARQTVVTINGRSSQSAALHRYLGELGGEELFSKVELASIESEQTGADETLRFCATLVVRPGYGQADGPVNPADNRPPQAADTSNHTLD